MNTRSLLSAALALALSAAASASFAAANTGTTFEATAQVLASCAVSASDLNFGAIDPLSGNATDQTSVISVTCTNGHAFNVGLDAGTSEGATVSTRRMMAGPNSLAYSLYSDAGRTANWGETIESDTVEGIGSGTEQMLTVYGRVPSQPTAVVGAGYVDTINVTVSY